MTDEERRELVEWLRNERFPYMHDAADEIERLAKELEQAERERDELLKQPRLKIRTEQPKPWVITDD